MWNRRGELEERHQSGVPCNQMGQSEWNSVELRVESVIVRMAVQGTDLGPRVCRRWWSRIARLDKGLAFGLGLFTLVFHFKFLILHHRFVSIG